MGETNLETNNSKVSMTFDDGGNYLEVAEKSTIAAEEYSNKLFMALLAGSGVSFLTLGGFLAGSDTSSALKSLYLYSLWYFAISLVLTFISGFCYSLFQSFTAISQRSMHNAKAFKRIINQANESVDSFDQFDDAAQALIESQKKDVVVWEERAKNFNEKSIFPLNVYFYSYILALFFFVLGVFTPLVSITFYDYF